MSNRIQLRPPLASKNDPTSGWCSGAEIGGADKRSRKSSASIPSKRRQSKLMFSLYLEGDGVTGPLGVKETTNG
jgi:hypothetical protein